MFSLSGKFLVNESIQIRFVFRYCFVMVLLAQAVVPSAQAANVWAVAPVPGAIVQSNYPLLKWDASESWSPTTLRLSRSASVDEHGRLTDPLYSFDVGNEFVDEDTIWRTQGAPWDDTLYWANAFGRSALFPGVYFWQVEGAPDEDVMVGEDGRTEHSPVRRLVVRRIVGKLSSVDGEETVGDSSVAFPLTISMRTNVPRVRLAFAMTMNDHTICRGNKPMTFDYGTDQSVSRTIVCRIPFSIWKGEDKNRCRVTFTIGTRADIGKTLRSVSRTAC